MRLAVALATLAMAGLLATAASAEKIRVQSNTGIRDSGQWAMLESLYLEENTGDSFEMEFVGAGKALENAESGKADVVIANAPSLEERFVEAGYSREALGRAIFYNDYVIVGPTSDPAEVAKKGPKDAVGAYEAIAAAGGNGKAKFISRNDASGTNVQEQILWGLSAVTPKRLACNRRGNPKRYEPGSGACGGGVPAWYVQTGQGQLENLETARKCTEESGAGKGCYTMLDRGTWIKNQKKVSNLKIVSEGNSEGMGGASLQTNYFHAYVLSTAKAPYPNGTMPNVKAAQRFIDFLVKQSTQEELAVYPSEAGPAGHPDAVAMASYSANPKPAHTNGQTAITVTIKYAAPPQSVLPHYPSVQLQRFGGGSWADVGGRVADANAAGTVTFVGVHVASGTTKFRVRLPRARIAAAGINTLFTAGVARGAILEVPVSSTAPEGASRSAARNSAKTPGHACHGDPVDCATGNFTEIQSDLEVGGLGVGLDLTRTYSALAAAEAVAPGPFGYGWSASFEDHLTSEESGKQITLTDASGATVPFTQSGSEWIAPSWSQYALTGGPESGYRLTLPNRVVYEFSGAGRLQGVADRNGNETTLSYNGFGKLTTVTDPSGRKLTLTYNAEGLVEKAKDPMGHEVKYGYESKNLKSVTLPGESSPSWQFEYDASHRMTKMTDGRGGETTNGYDSSSRVISQTDPSGNTTRFEYGEFHTTITSEATGAVTDEWFNEYNQPTQITRGFGTAAATTETFGYEGGLLTSRTDGNGQTTSFGYDTAGNLTSEQRPEGSATSWTFNSHHELVRELNSNGEITAIERDAHGNPETIWRPVADSEPQAVSYEYGPHGKVKSMTDPLGHVWTYEYDSQGDRKAEVDPEGGKRTWTYDEDSRVASTVSPRGNAEGAEPAKFTTSVERDTQGRPLKITDPLGHTTQYAYDANGNLESTTDPNGRKVKFVYDANNEQTKVERASGAVEETTYDGASAVTSQTDGNKHKTTYVRNVLEQPVEVIDPLERKTTQTFDAAGNLKTMVDPDGRTTSYAYDPANRLEGISYSDGVTPAASFAYDRVGNLMSMSDGSGHSTYEYDQLDRLVRSKDGNGDTVRWEYNLGDQVIELTYPNGKIVTRHFDKAGRLQSASDWLGHTTTFAYNADSQLRTITFPAATGDTDEYAFDRAGRISDVTMKKGAEVLASLTYARDPAGQLESQISNGLPAAEEEAFAYDGDERLITAGAASFEYDAADNLTKAPGTTNAYDKASQLESITGATLSYDKEGERTERTPSSGPATTYKYDQAGNLTAVERAAEGETPAITESLAYDGTGLLVTQAAGAATQDLAWDFSLALPLLLSDGENSYIYGPGGLPIEQVPSAGTPTYLHHDQLGSTRLLTDAEGKASASFTYAPYGGLEASTGSTSTPLRFAGQYTFAQSGLQYLRARFYDPATGQFMTRDPLEDATQAPYGYANENPLTYVDPSGLFSLGSVFEGAPGIPIPCPWCMPGGASQALEGVLGEVVGGGEWVLQEAFGAEELDDGEVPAERSCGEGTGWERGNREIGDKGEVNRDLEIFLDKLGHPRNASPGDPGWQPSGSRLKRVAALIVKLMSQLSHRP